MYSACIFSWKPWSPARIHSLTRKGDNSGRNWCTSTDQWWRGFWDSLSLRGTRQERRNLGEDVRRESKRPGNNVDNLIDRCLDPILLHLRSNNVSFWVISKQFFLILSIRFCTLLVRGASFSGYKHLILKLTWWRSQLTHFVLKVHVDPSDSVKAVPAACLFWWVDGCRSTYVSLGGKLINLSLVPLAKLLLCTCWVLIIDLLWINSPFKCHYLRTLEENETKKQYRDPFFHFPW